MLTRRALAFLALAAGCFNGSPDWLSGELRCEANTGSCPPGFVCAWDGRCYRPGEVPGEPPPDAPLACLDGDRRCDGKTQQSCMGGELVDVGDCDVHCLEGFCVECVPDSLRCDENQPQQCNASGGWNDLPGCAPPTPLCEDGACVAGCALGTTRCHPDGAAIQECDVEGVFHTVETCPFVCIDGACAGECRPDRKRCGPDQTPQTCSAAGVWENGTPCPGVCTGDGTCSGECRPASKRCVDNQLQTCGGDGTWGAGAPCAFVCLDGQSQCSGVCTPDAKRCSGNVAQTCSAEGQWVDGETCPEGTCTGGECAACVTGAMQCNADIPQECVDGVWQNLQESPCPFLCVDGMCTGVCVPGTFVCEGATSRACGEDATYDDTDCPFVCVAATGQCGGSCVPDSKRCSGDASQTCQPNGEWNSGADCSFGCDTATGECNACVPEGIEVTCAGGGCGDKTDNCGDSVACPECAAPDTCGGGGVAGICGCTPEPDECAGKCGMQMGKCGTIQCGTCPVDAGMPDAPLPPDAGLPDAGLPDAGLPDAPLPPDAPPPPDAPLDACVPTCGARECGSVTSCGVLLQCGTCEADEMCTSGGECVCGTEEICKEAAERGIQCGPYTSEKCKETVVCGPCRGDNTVCTADGVCKEAGGGDACEFCLEEAGGKTCCCRDGFDLFCSQDACPDGYSECGGGCSADPDPCTRLKAECGPVVDKCRQEVECGACPEVDKQLCAPNPDLPGSNECVEGTCLECCAKGGTCCGDPVTKGRYCAPKGETCPQGYEPICTGG